MNYVVQIKECADKQNESDLGLLEAMFTFQFLCLKCSCRSDGFFSLQLLRMHFHIISPPLYKHLHLSERLLTCTLLVNSFWLVITASVNLHSIVNGTDFHNFWTHKSEGRFEQIPTRIWWGLWLRLLHQVLVSTLIAGIHAVKHYLHI
jgi:hypothetical protein